MQTKNRILLIEDEEAQSETLKGELASNPITKGVDVEVWTPTREDTDFFETLNERLLVRPTLVVTDHVLSNNGAIGLLGTSISQWCQYKLIPVIEFSRNNKSVFPSNLDLFRLSVQDGSPELSTYIANVYDGFQEISHSINELNSLSELPYTHVLYEILNRNCQVYELSQYVEHMYKYFLFLFENINIENIGKFNFDDKEIDSAAIKNILIYITGHILVNSIMRFPGPILTDKSLCAYFAVHFDESNSLHEIFKNAQYDGPFNRLGQFYWKNKIDETVEKLVEFLPDNAEFSNILCMNRAALEKKIGRDLKKHECDRQNCNGERGGYFCPYSNKIVCEEEFCSVARSYWLPHGANMCRVDKDLYSKLSPVMAD